MLWIRSFLSGTCLYKHEVSLNQWQDFSDSGNKNNLKFNSNQIKL